MFCDNPKCRLHTFDDQDSVEVFEPNLSVFNQGGRPTKTKRYHNQRVVDPITREGYNLCEVCVGVVQMVVEMRERFEALPPLARAVKEAVNGNDQH